MVWVKHFSYVDQTGKDGMDRYDPWPSISSLITTLADSIDPSYISNINSIVILNFINKFFYIKYNLTNFKRVSKYKILILKNKYVLKSYII